MFDISNTKHSRIFQHILQDWSFFADINGTRSIQDVLQMYTINIAKLNGVEYYCEVDKTNNSLLLIEPQVYKRQL